MSIDNHGYFGFSFLGMVYAGIGDFGAFGLGMVTILGWIFFKSAFFRVLCGVRMASDALALQDNPPPPLLA